MATALRSMHLFGFAGGWDGADDIAALRRHLRSHFTGIPPVDAASGQPGDPTCVAPHLASAHGITAVVRGEPIWPFRAAGPPPPYGSPADGVLAAYRHSGRQFLEQIQGSFALAVVDKPGRTVLLAVDRMGIEQLAVAETPRGIVFGSSCGAVASCPIVRTALRNQALFDFFMLHMIPSPATVYEGIRKLEPGTCASYVEGRLTLHRYWRPEFTDESKVDVVRLEAQLHESLRSAVRACRPDAQTGAFLSGGLDSSTISGVLGIVVGKPARTFSIGFGVDAYNELAFARLAARHFGFGARHLHAGQGPSIDLPLRIVAELLRILQRLLARLQFLVGADQGPILAGYRIDQVDEIGAKRLARYN